MKRPSMGQAVVETILFAGSISLAAIGLWAFCNGKIVYFIDLVLASIASPAP